MSEVLSDVFQDLTGSSQSNNLALSYPMTVICSASLATFCMPAAPETATKLDGDIPAESVTPNLASQLGLLTIDRPIKSCNE